MISVEEYIRQDAGLCPLCEEYSCIEHSGGHYRNGPGTLLVTATCSHCKGIWTEIFVLNEISEE